MKKLLIALFALGTLSFVPVEAGRGRGRCPKACPKKEVCVQTKQTCPPKCSKRTVLTSEKWVPTMVPGRQKVKCYTTYETCSTTNEHCEEVPCEIECLDPNQQECMELE